MGNNEYAIGGVFYTYLLWLIQNLCKIATHIIDLDSRYEKNVSAL